MSTWVRFVPLVLVVMLGCDEDEGEMGGGTTEAPVEYEPGSQLYGQPCNEDADCVGGVCWRYDEVDEFCSGDVCSAPCQETADCRDPAVEGDAATPLVTECRDGVCDPSTSGVDGLSCVAPADPVPH